ncbi:PREDICTED: GATA zinc finger domain-containing protein 14-like [Bactrocera latifrons]|uniref:Uncharacterized protein n=1 Tax=Bactrocera latifrons TaxID=174628 RepID=A0A0K8W492_BACLA|nr:PREDICTED: GATA zinc finger domain-containing protein 14-like [Bactrocera latifrons]
MKISNEFRIVVAFFCVCLIYHIEGLPQPQYGSSRHHYNSTAWNNSGRHNATHQGPNHLIGHQNHTNPNNRQSHHRPGSPWQNNHHSNRRNWTQHIPISPQPVSNNGGGQFAPINSGWVAPSNSANSTNWKGGVSNISANREFIPQVNNGSNSYPTWHAGLPGSTLIAGTHTENTFPLSNSAGNRGIGSNLGPQLTPLAGSDSGHQNTAGWNLPSGKLNGTYSAHPYGKLFA